MPGLLGRGSAFAVTRSGACLLTEVSLAVSSHSTDIVGRVFGLAQA